ncbi:hypothetical protein JAAARDRAFT_43455 [Jaapia argillacea MUCL 33604]|uniref:Aminoglycoside phosphotransferase domain-containing protein n=1 Tax=Jaapia argillacea MUCL 33604 TaxID=933084 RepID=A0A067QP19_9AGAM|nr:hypothetical protein JAAARDRAFT_43455 [Jaapia argillacea MUCL 33604]
MKPAAVCTCGSSPSAGPEPHRRNRPKLNVPNFLEWESNTPSQPSTPPVIKSPTALEEEIAQGTVIFATPFRKVVKLRNNRIVKVRGGMRKEEAEIMQYVSEHTTIPLPGNVVFVREGAKTYLLMDYVNGEQLDVVWPQLTDSTKLSILADMKGYVAQLRDLREPTARTYIGSICYRPCSDRRVVGFYSAGPFDTERAFNDHVTAHLRSDIKAEQIRFVRNMMKDDHRILFAHGDLHPGNILVRDGRVVAILDWEMAGWYPEYWEWCKSLWNARWELEGWATRLEEWLEPYPMEYAVDRLLLQSSSPWW